MNFRENDYIEFDGILMYQVPTELYIEMKKGNQSELVEMNKRFFEIKDMLKANDLTEIERKRLELEYELLFVEWCEITNMNYSYPNELNKLVHK